MGWSARSIAIRPRQLDGQPVRGLLDVGEVDAHQLGAPDDARRAEQKHGRVAELAGRFWPILLTISHSVATRMASFRRGPRVGDLGGVGQGGNLRQVMQGADRRDPKF
jgi:hypothetical protein